MIRLFAADGKQETEGYVTKNKAERRERGYRRQGGTRRKGVPLLIYEWGNPGRDNYSLHKLHARANPDLILESSSTCMCVPITKRHTPSSQVHTEREINTARTRVRMTPSCLVCTRGFASALASSAYIHCPAGRDVPHPL